MHITMMMQTLAISNIQTYPTWRCLRVEILRSGFGNPEPEPSCTGIFLQPRRTSNSHRAAASAKRFFCKALAQPHNMNPRTITVDKNPAYPRAVADMKRAAELWRFSQLGQRKYLNNILEQDLRRIKRLVRPGLGFGGLETTKRTLAGYEVMAMIRRGQVHNVSSSKLLPESAAAQRFDCPDPAFAIEPAPAHWGTAQLGRNGMVRAKWSGPSSAWNNFVYCFQEDAEPFGLQ